MKNLIHEIHRRSLWQVLGIYLAGSWVALQVVEQLTEAAALPDWVRPFSLVLLVLGFPIVMATAFVQEGMTTRAPAPEVDEGALDEGPEQTAPAGVPPTGTRHRLFTWRNAIVGGVAAFALLGILTAGYLFMRTAGIGPAGTLVAAGVLDERDPILVAQLTSGSGDESLARTATEALRTDLAESPTVTLLTADQVSEGLARMQRDPGTPLDLALARELATREGIKAVIAGEVNAAGAGYVLTAQVISAADGAVLASRREAAADETEVIDAIDRLSKGIRERLGESLRSVRDSPPLSRMTTGSLEALRLYHEGHTLLGRGNVDGGMERLYEAVEIDTMFAAAWRRIATQLGNPGNPPEARRGQVEAATRGYRYRDRLTPYERIRAEAEYHRSVTGDTDRETAAYERGLEQFPESAPFLNNLALRMNARGDYARAEDLARRGIATGDAGGDWFVRGRLVQALLLQGRLDEADSVARESVDLFPDNARPFDLTTPVAIHLNRGEWAAAEAVLDTVGTVQTRTQYARIRGRLDEARATRSGRRTELDSESTAARYVESETRAALDELVITGRADRAAERLDAALARYPFDRMDELARPYTLVARLQARLGRTDAARRLLEEYRTIVMEPLGVVFDPGVHWARADIALADRRPDDALTELRRAIGSGCLGCPDLSDLARVHDAAGQADSAIAIYTRFAERPWEWDWRGRRGLERPPAYERLAQLYDEAGDLENAAEYYARFVDIWSDADEELQPRVRAAQARLEEILREIG